MALAQHEAVAVRPVRARPADAQHAAVEHGEQVGHREAGADVRAARAGDHVQDAQPEARADLCEVAKPCRRRLRREMNHLYVKENLVSRRHSRTA